MIETKLKNSLNDKFLICVFVIFTSILFSGCSYNQQIKQQESVKESKQTWLHWYDETYLAYYDVKGPVKILEVQALIRNGEQMGSSTWQYTFANNRLSVKASSSEQGEMETRYQYSDNRLDSISSRLNGELWRETQYRYQADKNYFSEYLRDYKNKTKYTINHQRIKTKDNWINLSLPVEGVDVINGYETADDGTLLWSSRGGFNNGMGLRYSIKTTDGVISSSVKLDSKSNIFVTGGYQFDMNDTGRLSAVISYSANDQGVYHTTSYQYNANGHLMSEDKQVTGKSIFNDAANENIRYEYFDVDEYGNWLSRRFIHTTLRGSVTYEQQRSITYN